MHSPYIPADRLTGWRLVDQRTDQPFALGPVSVTAYTVRYEPVASTDTDGSAAVAEGADIAAPTDGKASEPSTALEPFFFASRLQIRPAVSPNLPLTRLIERQAQDGFRAQLADNDITDVTHRAERSFDIEDSAAGPATLATFQGRCRVPDGDEFGDRFVPVEALLAVWSTTVYLLAGGAFPLETDAAESRRQLLELIHGVRTAP